MLAQGADSRGPVAPVCERAAPGTAGTDVRTGRVRDTAGAHEHPFRAGRAGQIAPVQTPQTTPTPFVRLNVEDVQNAAALRYQTW